MFLGAIALSGNPIPLIVFVALLIPVAIYGSFFSAEACAKRHNKKVLLEWRKLGVSSICNGHDFEHYIADILRRHGIKATVTPGSGDQGVDIVAVTRSRTRIAIQAKLYSKNVTNKAVQEVFAGKHHHKCSVALVITNSLFTQSAIQLAASTGVKLIDFEQMKKFENGTHWIYKL